MFQRLDALVTPVRCTYSMRAGSSRVTQKGAQSTVYCVQGRAYHTSSHLLVSLDRGWDPNVCSHPYASNNFHTLRSHGHPLSGMQRLACVWAFPSANCGDHPAIDKLLRFTTRLMFLTSAYLSYLSPTSGVQKALFSRIPAYTTYAG